LRGVQGTVHLVRGDGAPGSSNESPPGDGPFHDGRSTLAELAGPLGSCAASADAESTLAENVRRENFFIKPPAAMAGPLLSSPGSSTIIRFFPAGLARAFKHGFERCKPVRCSTPREGFTSSLRNKYRICPKLTTSQTGTRWTIVSQ